MSSLSSIDMELWLAVTGVREHAMFCNDHFLHLSVRSNSYLQILKG